MRLQPLIVLLSAVVALSSGVFAQAGGGEGGGDVKTAGTLAKVSTTSSGPGEEQTSATSHPPTDLSEAEEDKADETREIELKVSEGVAGTANTNHTLEPGDDKNTNAGPGAIVGGVIGGLVGVALVGLLIWFGARRRRKQIDIQQRSRALVNLDKATPASPSPTPGITDAPLPAVPVDRDSIGGNNQTTRSMPPVLQTKIGDVENGPVELQSREVDPDGVSVRSFDLEQGTRPKSNDVPRLPIYGGGNPAL